MSDENHMYMDDSNNKHEIFGWMWSMNELLDDNWNWQIVGWIFLLIEYMDENNSKTIMMNGNYWTHIIFMSNFIQKKRCQRWNSKELHYNAKRWNNNLCYKLNEVTSM